MIKESFVSQLSLKIAQELGSFCYEERVMVDEYDYSVDTKNYQLWVYLENTENDIYRVYKVEVMTFDGVVNERFPNLVTAIQNGVICDCSGWHKEIEREAQEEEELEEERKAFERDPYSFYGVSREMFV